MLCRLSKHKYWKSGANIFFKISVTPNTYAALSRDIEYQKLQQKLKEYTLGVVLYHEEGLKFYMMEVWIILILKYALCHFILKKTILSYINF